MTGCWKPALFERLRDKPHPLIVEGDRVTPGASLWTASRRWCEAFRATGMQPGDRIVLALEPSIAFVQVFIAALWESYSIILVPPGNDEELVLQQLDARCIISSTPSIHAWRPNDISGPGTTFCVLRDSSLPLDANVRFLLRTSGTTGEPKWIALSDNNVWSVLESHLPLLDMKDAIMVSALPWSHAFGLVFDLMTGLMVASEIVIDNRRGKVAEHTCSLIKQSEATHYNAVPLQIRKILDCPGGLDVLQQLKGGIVGGAAVSYNLAQALGNTSLRVGYGQTEASPGISLGLPGVWKPNYLGKPLGCKVRIDQGGMLHYQGPNTCYGIWDNGLTVLPHDRWVASNDFVHIHNDDVVFRGRTNNVFKLSNATYFNAGYWEAVIREKFPLIEDSVFFQYEDLSLGLAYTINSTSKRPILAEIQHLSPVLSKHLVGLDFIDPHKWPTSPKGCPNRSVINKGHENLNIGHLFER